MTTTMTWDLIPLLPLQYVTVDSATADHSLLFVLKIIRLRRGINGFDIGEILKIIKSHQA